MSRYLRYKDLHERGIVNNRVSLQNWIRKNGFPRGVMLGPNSRAWREEDVERWLASRPAAKVEILEHEAI